VGWGLPLPTSPLERDLFWIVLVLRMVGGHGVVRKAEKNLCGVVWAGSNRTPTWYSSLVDALKSIFSFSDTTRCHDEKSSQPHKSPVFVQSRIGTTGVQIPPRALSVPPRVGVNG
jgi:hypothetical protein